MKIKRFLALILALSLMFSIAQVPATALEPTFELSGSISVQIAPSYSYAASSGTDSEGYTTYELDLPSNPTFDAGEYYANQLTDFQKQLYRGFMDGFCDIEADDLKLKQKVVLNYTTSHSASISSQEELEAYFYEKLDEEYERIQGQTLYDAIQYDHTELFWVHGAGLNLGSGVSYRNGIATFDWDVELLVDASELYSSDAALVSAAKNMNSTVDTIIANTPKTSEYDSVVYFNKWLKDNNTYNHPHLENNNYPLAHAAISAFVSNNVEAVGPVCQGYAYAFKYLCDKMGIDCVVVTGDLYQAYADPGPHAWNAVELDGKWYGVDVTSNDSLSSDKYNFLVGSESNSSDPTYKTFSTSHVIDDTHEYPTLSQTAYQHTSSCNHIYDNACDADCNVCGEKRTVGAHTYDDVCDADCNVCGTTRTPVHAYDNSCDPTCNKCGTIRAVSHIYDNDCDPSCNRCGAARAASHVYDNGCDPTCNKCGNVRATSHTYDNDSDKTCNVCGHERGSETPASSFDYTIEGNQVTIKGYYGSETAIVVPSLIEGYPVTKIGNYAFDNSNFVSVKLPNSVQSVGEQAFAWSKSLKSIEFGTGLKVIGPDAFNDCAVLENVTLPDGLEEIKYGAFIGCNALTHVVIPDSVTKLGGSVFMHCFGIETLVIGSGVTTIPEHLLYNCNELKSVTFTNSVKTVCYGAISHCDAFTDIYFIGSKQDKESIEIDPLWNDIIKNSTWHYFGSACDTTCSECDHVREAIDHTYDNDSDDTCNVCGEKRVIAVIIPGDVNGDGTVNNKDLGVLRRYLNDWDVEIDEQASDVNDDGSVNNKDMGLLRRYLNDWDVVLK